MTQNGLPHTICTSTSIRSVRSRGNHQQVGAHGRRAARLPGGLAVHLAANLQRAHRRRRALPTGIRSRAHRRPAAAAGRRTQRVQSTAGRPSARCTRRSEPGCSTRHAKSTHCPGPIKEHDACWSRCCATPDDPANSADALDDTSLRRCDPGGDRGSARTDGPRRRHADPALPAAGRHRVLRSGDQPCCRVPTMRVDCGTTSSPWPSSAASRSSSAACANDRSWPVSVSTPNQLARGGLARRQQASPEVTGAAVSVS